MALVRELHSRLWWEHMLLEHGLSPQKLDRTWQPTKLRQILWARAWVVLTAEKQPANPFSKGLNDVYLTMFILG